MNSIEDLRAVGKALPRVDGTQKVTGSARFAAEVPFDDITYAALVYSAIARGSIVAIDTVLASASPGVLLVMTYQNAPRMAAPPLAVLDPKGGAASKLPVMQDANIAWNGQPVALVVAETQEQADQAARLVGVRYQEQPAVLDFALASRDATAPEMVMGEPSSINIGDAGQALAGAAYAVDQRYRTPRLHHGAIELHAVTAAWQGDHLTLHDTSQTLNLTRSTMAAVFGIGEENVRVLSPFVGGGFGSKMVWNHHILTAAAARLTGRPLRTMLTREGVFRAVGGRTLTEQRVALGTDADGTLLALIHSGVAGMTAHNYCPEQFTFPARHLYAAKNIALAQEIVPMNMVANTFMRAPGEAVGTFALESAIDELAERMAMDPVQLRCRWEPRQDPTTGLPFSMRNLSEAYRLGAERFGWARRNPLPRAQRDGEWLVGHGVATATYPYLRMPGGKVQIRLTDDGHAVLQSAMHEMGMGTATVQAQYAADRLGLPVERVRFEYGDSDFPAGTMAGGSSQSASIIAVVEAASTQLVVDLMALVQPGTPLHGLAPVEVEPFDSGLRCRQTPARYQSYADILHGADRQHLVSEGAAPPVEEVKTHSMHSYGAQFCEVRVNAVTGETRVTRWVGAFDTGRILNPQTASSQFRGGIIMGLGLALMEEVLFDQRSGRIMNPSLAEYHVPVHLDVPEIEVLWTGVPDPFSPHGVHGIGEIGITGVAAALANAVYNATGIRVRELPITLDKLLG